MIPRICLTTFILLVFGSSASARDYFVVLGGGAGRSAQVTLTPTSEILGETGGSGGSKIFALCPVPLEEDGPPPMKCRAALLKIQQQWQRIFVACPDQPIRESYVKSLETYQWGHTFHLVGQLGMEVPAGTTCLAAKKRQLLGAGLTSISHTAATPTRQKLFYGPLDPKGSHSVVREALKDSDVLDMHDPLPGALARFKPRNIFMSPVRHPRAVGVAIARFDFAARDENDWPEATGYQVAILFDDRGRSVERLSAGLMSCAANRTSARCSRVPGIGDLDGDGRTDLLIDDRGHYVPEMGSIILRLSSKKSPIVLGHWYGG